MGFYKNNKKHRNVFYIYGSGVILPVNYNFG